MKWRAVDNWIASNVIQLLQKEINEGKKNATTYLFPVIQDEARAKEAFNAWRVYFIDRMSAEYDNHNFKDDGGIGSVQQIADIQHDIDYYNKLVEEEQERKEKRKK